MDTDQTDPALRAANLALTGRRLERAASRFASIELRGLERHTPNERRSMVWEVAALLSVGGAALLAAIGLWLW
ncbi:MAG: hypothetical protein RJA70_3984 [Pseudomonadota bacterium]|jgi:hypothetical protein